MNAAVSGPSPAAPAIMSHSSQAPWHLLIPPKPAPADEQLQPAYDSELLELEQLDAETQPPDEENDPPNPAPPDEQLDPADWMPALQPADRSDLNETLLVDVEQQIEDAEKEMATWLLLLFAVLYFCRTKCCSCFLPAE